MRTNINHVRIASIALLILLAGCATTSQQERTVQVRKTALAGKTIHLGIWTDLNPDCTFVGYAQVTVTKPAVHGIVTVAKGEGYSSYASTNQRYGCNRQKSLGISVDYTPAEGFAGSDRFSLRAVFPEGGVHLTDYVVVVERGSDNSTAGQQ
jgi:hypothetical protein